MLKNKEMDFFYGKFENEKKKEQNKFWPSVVGIWTPYFQ